jgi:hypothetical protein
MEKRRRMSRNKSYRETITEILEREKARNRNIGGGFGDHSRVRKRFTEEELRRAACILNLDVRRKGRVFKAVCPDHGRQSLAYHYQTNSGVKVFCEVERCGWETLIRNRVWQH